MGKAGLKKIIELEMVIFDLSISADSSTLMYTTYNSDSGGDVKIFLAKSDGSNLTNISDNNIARNEIYAVWP